MLKQRLPVTVLSGLGSSALARLTLLNHVLQNREGLPKCGRRRRRGRRRRARGRCRSASRAPGRRAPRPHRFAPCSLVQRLDRIPTAAWARCLPRARSIAIKLQFIRRGWLCGSGGACRPPPNSTDHGHLVKWSRSTEREETLRIYAIQLQIKSMCAVLRPCSFRAPYSAAMNGPRPLRS